MPYSIWPFIRDLERLNAAPLGNLDEEAEACAKIAEEILYDKLSHDDHEEALVAYGAGLVVSAIRSRIADRAAGGQVCGPAAPTVASRPD